MAGFDAEFFDFERILSGDLYADIFDVGQVRCGNV